MHTLNINRKIKCHRLKGQSLGSDDPLSGLPRPYLRVDISPGIIKIRLIKGLPRPYLRLTLVQG